MVLAKAFLLFLVVWLIAGVALTHWARSDRERRRRVLWGLGAAMVMAVLAVVGMLALVIGAMSRMQ